MPAGGGLALLLAPVAIGAWGWRGYWVVLAFAAAASFALAARYVFSPERGKLASLRLIRESLVQPGNLALAALFAFYVSQWASVMIWFTSLMRGASASTSPRRNPFESGGRL
jgi:hypothetical protein